MKASDFRLCPNCGTRNKSKWEFCAKCGESLQEVPLGGAEASVAAPVAEGEEAEPLPGRTIAGFAAALAVAVGLFFAFRNPPAPTSPAIFSAPTVPQSIPAATPAPPKPTGRAEYEAGLQRLNQNDPAGAAPLFAQAVAADSQSALYRHAYAVALFQSGAREASLSEYRAALALDPDNTTYRLNFGKVLAKMGMNEDAAREFTSILNREPSNAEALQQLGRVYAATGDNAGAIETLRKTAAMRPGDAVAQQELAMALEKGGDFEGAKGIYAQVLGKNPEAHITRGLLAEAYYRQGDGEQAVVLLREGLQSYPQAPLLHRNLASMLERTGKVEEAVAEYREYARLAPDSADARQLKERAEKLEKKIASAP
jgi:Tfp pilus assembly protein PilF